MAGDFGPLPQPTGTGRPDAGPGSTRWRERHQVIGGYYMGQGETQTAPPIGGLSPASAMFARPAQTFDPYRQGDMRRILQRQVNNGSLFDLQDSLVQAGLLGDRYTPGYLDGNTTDAFNALLSIANQQGMDWRDVLSQAIQGGGTLGQQGGPGQQVQPTIITLPNRDDSIKAADDMVLSMTGERLDDDLNQSVADSMLNALRSHQERQYQREIGMTEGLHFTEDHPDPARLMEEAIRERAPQQVAGRGAQNARDIWFEGLGGPVG
jgi:hypothetical protein